MVVEAVSKYQLSSLILDGTKISYGFLEQWSEQRPNLKGGKLIKLDIRISKNWTTYDWLVE